MFPKVCAGSSLVHRLHLDGDLNKEIEGSLSKFADHAKQGGMADTLEGCAAIQQDLDRLEG